MNRFTSLLRKELTEFARTWKIWVIPGLFIVLAVTGVLSARFAKELMQSLLPAGSDMSTLIPDPTWRDTLGQWTKNLSQIGTIAILLMSGGIINTEGAARHTDPHPHQTCLPLGLCTGEVRLHRHLLHRDSDRRSARGVCRKPDLLPRQPRPSSAPTHRHLAPLRTRSRRSDPHRVGQLHQHLGCVWPWPRVHACPQPARPLGTGSEVLSRWVGGCPEQDHGGRTCHILVAHLDRACRRRCLRRASRVAVLEARAVSNLTEESTHWQSTQPSRALKRPD